MLVECQALLEQHEAALVDQARILGLIPQEFIDNFNAVDNVDMDMDNLGRLEAQVNLAGGDNVQAVIEG